MNINNNYGGRLEYKNHASLYEWALHGFDGGYTHDVLLLLCLRLRAQGNVPGLRS